ncbi:sensor histidine kinase [Cohnella hashimotonis]|uniref:Histidine kinase n=1 Tax=Cohnella hashimotonis TaxID=2826895 RepID=A0ABT6TES3_9BACL|nr:histidine kinase [Cohnella hashimotonis]MDI4645185.1 histidine kinase [Cohnella hashimotonis]
MKLTTFGKVIGLILCLLIPIIVLYGYSYRVSIDTVRGTIEDQNSSRLGFFVNQMDMMVDQLVKHSVTTSRDYSIREYLEGRSRDDLRVQLQRQSRIVDMLNMQTSTSAWSNQIIFYLKDSKETISTDYSAKYNEALIDGRKLGEWSHENMLTFGIKENLFTRLQETDHPNVLVEVRFNDVNLKNMLVSLKQQAAREPFLYFPGEDPIMGFNADFAAVKQTAAELDRQTLAGSGSFNVKLNGGKYIVHYVRSASLGWYLVDMVPLGTYFAPINMSRNLVYASIALLMTLSVLAALLLYRNVQRPISLLLRGVRHMRDGDFSFRLSKRPGNEFDFLFLGFNEMAKQIQELIDKVYKETLRSKEATLKQLQSQINPHFLYNCLFYIKNMANLGEKQAVVDMALNLGEYYRYTTRQEQETTTLQEELKLIRNYLNIQSMRLQRFHFEIEIPEAMLSLRIPRLLLQPLVENAVIHGVENSVQFGLIVVRGEQDNGVIRVAVDDNGPGVSEEKLAALQARLAVPMDEHTGTGLWNIHQRLIYMYGGRSGLAFAKSPLGGFRAELIWEEKEGAL